MEERQNVIIFQSGDGTIGLDVEFKDETVWLSQKQLCELFERDKSVISRHINNIFKSGELSKEATVAKNATVQTEGSREVVREIELLRKGEASDLFGREKANEFKGIVRNIYQTFGGDDLLPSIEEKAANLLYYIIKDHPFNDGIKRIGAFLFILTKCNIYVI